MSGTGSGEQLIGISLVALSVAMWSLAPSLASRAAVKAGRKFDSRVFNAWRVVVAATATLPFALYYGFPFHVPWSDPVFEAGVIVGGVLSTVVGDTLFVYSVSRIGASLAIPVAYLFLIWSALIDYATGRVGWIVLVSSGLGLAGIWLAFSGSRGRDWAGLVAALATSLIWAASLYGYDYAVEAATRAGLDVVGGSILIGEVRAIYSLVLMTPYLRLNPIRGVVWETVLSSMTGYVVGALAFIASLAFLAPSIVSIGLALTPMATQAAATLLAGEKLEPRVVLGAGLVSASIAITVASA